MIVVTGAAGFIGSCLVAFLNAAGRKDLILVDDFSRADKQPNHAKKQHLGWSHRDAFLSWFDSNHSGIEAVYHLGARTDTTEQDSEIFDRLNLNYSKGIWTRCARYNIPLVYASSAATYGLGELGYVDGHAIVPELKPLNPYGRSKNDFDAWALQQEKQPPRWYGLKFFNVYGPNEYHKGRMASVIFHAFNQIQANGKVRLFRSHRADVADGQQSRDFVYVKDVVQVCAWLMNSAAASGLYNLGTGKARPFYDLARATFGALELEPVIEFIDTPIDIRDTYQYFTEADMGKLVSAGYEAPFHSLEAGVKDYVQGFLLQGIRW